VVQTAAWVARKDVSPSELGLGTERACALAKELLIGLRAGTVDLANVELDDTGIDVLHAAIEVLALAPSEDPNQTVADLSRLYEFSSSASWPVPTFGEKEELLEKCALWAWRLCRRAGRVSLAEDWAGRACRASGLIHDFSVDPNSLREGTTSAMNGRVLRFPSRSTSVEDAKRAAERVLCLSQADQRTRAVELQLEEPEMLLALCGELRRRLEESPTLTYEETSFLYEYLSTPARPIGLFDEREYFLGELSLLAGTACRALARRDEARRWFDRSEANFRLTVNVVADWARVSYQRLAILLEERRFDELAEQLPPLVECFEKLDMNDDALKCRFLEATALVEAGHFLEARDHYLGILGIAQKLGNERLVAAAKVNLVQVYGSMADQQEALDLSREVVPLLRKLGLKEYLAKTQWGIGSLLRSAGRLGEAVDALRSAHSEFSDLRMMADVAATQLLTADVLLEAGREAEAVAEVMAALPTVDEYRLVPEGMAALALLRESVRQHRVNHQALRDLHGFFEETVS
jgi:tetratricopeptide (TPR) repeat protein